MTDHYRRLVRLAGLVCLDRTEAQDAVQNALERAWRHRSSLRDETKVGPWLDAIVVREAIRLNRAPAAILRALVRPLLRTDEPATAVSMPMPTGLIDDLRRLPAAQRAVLALHYEAGYSIAETAGLVRAPVETVRSRLRLARQRLRRELRDSAEDAP
ncbi:MAG: RNA polymerase sigma factor [Candidatus Limnocylindria bacterium]